MGSLIKAEFRKITSTRLWWALLIPTVALATLTALGWAAFTSDTFDALTGERAFLGLQVQMEQVSWSAIAVTRSINLTTIFPMIFGALAISAELNHRTITTSFLTGSSRGAVLSAKAIAYAVWGAVFGVAIVASSCLGAAISSDPRFMPEFGQLALIALAGIGATVLWTLLGLGVGALIGSSVGALVVLLVYALVVGPVGELILFAQTDGSHLPGLLPNGSASGFTGATAASALVSQVKSAVLNAGGSLPSIGSTRLDEIEEAIRWAAGTPGALSLGLSALVFAGWTLLFFGTGVLRNRNRDIT
ncbi:ABC transporter permease [Actinokineospora auranticolor]|uniref:ABC-2 type transport system permease protein n=1 Tax=Actinokineospora auranticolor TaxID=155976 RepID=A0A2S6GXL0_9PSEU|nr:ABC transporter permease [Actinokineospora auranticolor]PPK69901.1 ABC-2 type transport system permease protein [Actinokineospora auranticolor]